MGYLARRRAKREAARVANEQRYVNERTNVVDPTPTALLYGTLYPPSEFVDTVDDDDDDVVDSYDSESDRYHTEDADLPEWDTPATPVDPSYGQNYDAPTYDFSGPSESSSSSYDAGSSDSGSYSSSD